ncbi:MAG: translocase [Sandaracinus sp.]|nr:translocase [Sandaracinus sp.]
MRLDRAMPSSSPGSLSAPAVAVTPLDDERRTTALMGASVFVLLFAYYLLKTAREPLVLALPNGPELKAYAGGAQAVALVALVPMVDRLARGTSRLLFGVLGFFLATLLLFAIGSALDWPIGFAFYVWLGVLNVSAVALFWGFANERFSRAAGERAFPRIAIGMTAGGFAGSFLAGRLFDAEKSPSLVLCVAAGLLLVHLALYLAVLPERSPVAEAEAPRAYEGARLLWRDPYLRAVALLLVVLNVATTTAEYTLGRRVVESLAGSDPRAIGAFYGDFYFGVNVAALALQLLLAPRLVRRFGLSGVLLAAPVMAILAFGGLALGVPALAFAWMKGATNAADYSLMNTGRALLWLPTSRTAKYAAKHTADTLVVRLGDLLSAGLVFAGTSLAIGIEGFAWAGVGVAGVWLVLAVYLGRRYRAAG